MNGGLSGGSVPAGYVSRIALSEATPTDEPRIKETPMLSKTILTSAAALILTTGLGIGSAAAHQGGPQHGKQQFRHFPFPIHQVCRPEFRLKPVWTRHGWRVKRVYVGRHCYWPRLAEPHSDHHKKGRRR